MANHVMQTALLPQHIHKKIDRIKRNFFLGHQANTRKLHPINWKIVGKNKSAGGLGIRTSETMNKALILKRLWVIHDQPESMWSSNCSGKYLSNSSLLHPISVINSNPSPLWRDINKLLSMFNLGMFHQINSGDQTNIWSQHWIPGVSTIPNNTSQNIHTISQLFKPGTNS